MVIAVCSMLKWHAEMKVDERGMTNKDEKFGVI